MYKESTKMARNLHQVVPYLIDTNTEITVVKH